jgi:NADH-quinone oxidoreductase subunit L
LYQATIIPFTLGLSKFLYWVDDLWVIDPIVNGIGRAGVWLAGLAAAFDSWVVDGAVNGAGWFTDRLGRVLRNTQDGHVQVYLVVAVVTVTVWLLLKAMPLILTLV